MKNLILLTAALCVGGCSPAPYVQRHFGETVQAAAQQQTVERKPGKPVPVATDGQTANAVMDRYHESYAKPAKPTNVFNIGVGTRSAGGIGK